MAGERVGTRLTKAVRRWLERAEHEYVLRRSGGNQTCPWCRQGVNHFTGTHVRTFTPDPMLDEIVCGNCGGTSIWKWEMGFVFITAGDRPPAADAAPGFSDSDFIRGVVANVCAAIAERETRRRAALQPRGDHGG